MARSCRFLLSGVLSVRDTASDAGVCAVYAEFQPEEGDEREKAEGGEEMTESVSKNSASTRTERFVESVISRIKKDNGFRAAMTRADHESTAPQAWRFLLDLGNVDLGNEPERLAFALIGAAIARERTESNGKQSLGQALYYCKADPKEEDSSIERRLRRILACEDRLELITVLRQTIWFMQRSEKVSLDYERLLSDVLYFSERTKVRWAQDYYGRRDGEDVKEAE